MNSEGPLNSLSGGFQIEQLPQQQKPLPHYISSYKHQNSLIQLECKSVRVQDLSKLYLPAIVYLGQRIQLQSYPKFQSETKIALPNKFAAVASAGDSFDVEEGSKTKERKRRSTKLDLKSEKPIINEGLRIIHEANSNKPIRPLVQLPNESASEPTKLGSGLRKRKRSPHQKHSTIINNICKIKTEIMKLEEEEGAEEYYQCPVCVRSFLDIDICKRHIQQKHPKPTLSLNEQQSVEYKKHQLNRNKSRTSEPSERNPCKIPGCSQVFNTLCERDQHENSAHLSNDGKVGHSVAPKTFVTIPFDSFFEFVSDETDFQNGCVYCFQKFKSKEKYLRHIREEHPEFIKTNESQKPKLKSVRRISI